MLQEVFKKKVNKKSATEKTALFGIGEDCCTSGHSNRPNKKTCSCDCSKCTMMKNNGAGHTNA